MSVFSVWTTPGRRLALPCWVVLMSSMLSQVSWSAEQGRAAPDLLLPVLTASHLTTAGSYQSPDLLRLSDFRGKVVYLDFWDTFCAPCRDSLPLLSKLQQRLGPEQVEIFSVNLDVDPRRAEQFLAEHPVAFTVVSDPSAASARSYGLESLPTGIFIDREGRVVGVHRGFRRDDLALIEERLSRLLAAR